MLNGVKKANIHTYFRTDDSEESDFSDSIADYSEEHERKAAARMKQKLRRKQFQVKANQVGAPKFLAMAGCSQNSKRQSSKKGRGDVCASRTKSVGGISWGEEDGGRL